MSTRGRGNFVKLTLLALLVMFAFLLLLNSLHGSNRELQQLELQEPRQLELEKTLKTLEILQVPAPKATPPPVQTIEEPVNEELVKQLENELPEVDYGFWYRYAKPQKYQKSPTCGKYPDPLDLQMHNIYWQTFNNANVTFRLYAAYLDMRVGIKTKGVVRVLATANQIGVAFPITHCQLWYADHPRPIMVKVESYISVWIKSWGYKPLLSYPHFVMCPVPEELPPNIMQRNPSTVSLVSSSCEHATNSLRIHYDNPNDTMHDLNATTRSEPNFGVCVKGFDFPYVDLSARLIEWFELQRLLGASKIYAYMYDVHPGVQRVLDYYQRSGFLELRPLTMANGMPRLRHYQHMLIQQRRLVKRLNELIPYNDCFYRNMYRHDYLLNADIDEIIMPVGALRNWQDILHTDQKLTILNCPKGFVAYCFINTYFTKVIPEAVNHEQLEADELYVLQHTLRHQKYSAANRATKCFHNTRYSETLHNHFTLKWLPGGCSARTIDTQFAQMQHYREPDNKYNLTELVEDRNAWKYAPELRAAVEHVWLHLDDAAALSVDAEEQILSLEESLDHESDVEQAQEQQQMLQQAKLHKT